MSTKNFRPIKVLLSADLIDQLDEALQRGTGGFRTRHHLISEAINYYLLELDDAEIEISQRDVPHSIATSENEMSLPEKYGTKEGVEDSYSTNSGLPPAQAAVKANPALSEILDSHSIRDLTQISSCKDSQAVPLSASVARAAEVPIIGMHNRDWPTLQALSFLGILTVGGAIPVRDFYWLATAAAWQISDFLESNYRDSQLKINALLPGNRSKAKASESNYTNFALGRISSAQTGEDVDTDGPLFQWGLSSLFWQDENLLIGLSEHGQALLNELDGMGPDIPHSSSHAQLFMNYLKRQAIADYEIFEFILQVVEQGTNREQLIHKIKKRTQKSQSIAATYTQGYISRAREWGFVEPRLEAGQYRLTSFGADFLKSGV